ncbi:MAG: DCC1-like thiol-disulfide oxidoreductase family protein [Elusimicrobiota bacterium]
MKKAAGWWDVLFLESRPSISLSLFRMAVAATVGLHVLPTFLEMGDNYLSTAFREYNPSFFPVPFLEWTAGNPDWAVWAMAGVFTASLFFFFIGFLTPLSGAVLYAGSYYFYARNSLHIGTLSWDMFLAVFFLVFWCPYLGDSFSVDSLLRGDPEPWLKKRPFFIQRLLQMVLASFYFYTALWKCWPGGNWLGDHPFYYLMHYPDAGVMKQFPGRSILAASPELCDWVEGIVLVSEFTAPLWLFWRRTRVFAVAAGFLFHALLVLTMHVPTIFFFLFPPMLLLFIDPEDAVAWIERRREAWAKAWGRHRLIFDGSCGFCRASLARLRALDPAGRLEAVDFRATDASLLHPALTPEACLARIHLLERDGRLSGGFDAFRRLSLLLPMLWPLAPLMNVPGLGLLGEPVYDWIARRRFGFHAFQACRDNACLRGE